MPAPSSDEIEAIRRQLIAHQVDERRAGLSRALALDEQGQYAVMSACDITGQSPLSDEIVELLSIAWREWPTLTRLCLRGCWFLSRRGCEILARQNYFIDLSLSGCSQLDDDGLAALGNLALDRLELWDAGNCSAAGASCLARMPTLRQLEWHNAPDDPAATAALATSQTIRRLAYTCKGSGAPLIAPLAKLARLEHLTIFDVDDASLAVLTPWSSLTTLEIDHSPRVGDAGVAAVAKMASLKSLRLIQTDITDDALERLAASTHLEALWLVGCTKVTDRGLESIGRLRSLARLRLQDLPQITDRGLAALKPPVLECARLSGCTGVGDDGLRALCRHHRLEELALDGSSITDIGLSALHDLALLREISLRDTKITSDGLRSITAAVKLKKLDLGGCSAMSSAPTALLSVLTQLEQLVLPHTAALDATDAGRIAASCPQLVSVTAGFRSRGAVRAMTLLPQLTSLLIDGAPELEDDELASLAKRPLDELAIFGAPWLSESALDPFEKMPSLRRVQIACCPGIGQVALRRLAGRCHLQVHGRHWYRPSSSRVCVLRAQLLTDDVPRWDESRGISQCDDAKIIDELEKLTEPRRISLSIHYVVGANPSRPVLEALAKLLRGTESNEMMLAIIEALRGCADSIAIEMLASVATARPERDPPTLKRSGVKAGPKPGQPPEQNQATVAA